MLVKPRNTAILIILRLILAAVIIVTMAATAFGPPRRSETVQQQEYEDQILGQHYSTQRIQGDERELEEDDADDRNDDDDDDNIVKKQKEKPIDKKQRHNLPGQFPDAELQKKGVKGKLKAFWNKTVVPAFPEAVGDISLIKKAVRVEAGVTKDIKDPHKYPEVDRVAEVRRGLDLCAEEREWLSAWKIRVKTAFCRYMGLDEAEAHVDDVPVVGFGGSGGGYRAMIGLLGYAAQMRQSGLWDLLSYVAGVSGSCWSLAAYYTWAAGDWQRVVGHFKERLSPFHPLSPEAV